MARTVVARQARQVAVGQVAVWYGKAGLASYVMACYGELRSGSVWLGRWGKLWCVEVWCGLSGIGMVRQARQGLARRGVAGRGELWQGRHGKLRSGKVLSGTAQVTKQHYVRTIFRKAKSKKRGKHYGNKESRTSSNNSSGSS